MAKNDNLQDFIDINGQAIKNLKGANLKHLESDGKLNPQNYDLELNDIDVLQATSIKPDVSPTTINANSYLQGNLIVEAMDQYKGATSVTPSTSDVTLQTSQKYNASNITIKGDVDLKSENIKTGVSIFNVNGALEPKLPNYTGSNVVYPSQAGTTLPTNGKSMTSDISVRGDANFKAENIKEGVKIWNVTGTAPSGVEIKPLYGGTIKSIKIGPNSPLNTNIPIGKSIPRYAEGYLINGATDAYSRVIFKQIAGNVMEGNVYAVKNKKLDNSIYFHNMPTVDYNPNSSSVPYYVVAPTKTVRYYINKAQNHCFYIDKPLQFNVTIYYEELN